MKDEDELSEYECCYNAEAATTVCLMITLCLLTCCAVFVPEEDIIIVALAVVLLGALTIAAILLKEQLMLIPLIFTTALLIGGCLFLLVRFNMQHGDVIELKLLHITSFTDHRNGPIRIHFSSEGVQVALCFALLYFALQMLTVYECIRYYKFTHLLKEAIKREQENAEWMKYIDSHCVHVYPLKVSGNSRTVIIPSAPPYTNGINAFQPQPDLFPSLYGQSTDLSR